MERFLYESLYVFLPALSALFYYYTPGGPVSLPAGCALSILPALFLLSFRHLKSHGRLLLCASVTAFLGIYAYGLFRRPEIFAAADPLSLLPYLLIAVASFAAGILLARYRIIRLLSLAVVIAVYVLSLLKLLYPNRPGVFFLLLLFLLLLVTECQSGWKREGSERLSGLTIGYFPFLALTVLVVSFVKYPKKPYDWHFFVTAWEKMSETFDQFSFSFLPGTDKVIGFSEKSELTDSLQENAKDILSVEALDDVNAPVCFAGSIFDTFNGQSWKSNARFDLPLATVDAVESRASSDVFGGVRGDLYRSTRLSVQYLEAKSKYLFTPLKPTSQAVYGKTRIRQKGGSFVFARSNAYHQQVNLVYMRANTENPLFYEYMKTDTPITKQNWDQTLFVLQQIRDSYENSYDVYKACQEQIEKTYTEDIELSEGVRELIDPVLSGCESDYEKCKKLEAFLSGMDYSLSPPDIPKEIASSSQFLDFFLLQSHTGYCSHYATSFVLLARSLGLPARYVQGYRVRIGDKGTYIVKSNMAHAWPEVYYAGKGWIAFEPTPGFYTGDGWETAGEKAWQKQETQRSTVEKTVYKDREEASEETAEEDDEPESRIRISKEGLLKALGWAVVLFIAVFALGKLLQKIRFKKLDESGRFFFLTGECLSILRLLRLGMERGETLEEYGIRIGGDLTKEDLSFLEAYERMLYAKDPPSGALQRAEESRRSLMGQLKKRRRILYFWRVLLG